MITVAKLEIENVIVASHLGKDIELIKLATELPNARYSSSGNPSVIIESVSYTHLTLPTRRIV